MIEACERRAEDGAKENANACESKHRLENEFVAIASEGAMAIDCRNGNGDELSRLRPGGHRISDCWF